MAVVDTPLVMEATIKTHPSITSLDFNASGDWQLASSLAEVHPALRQMPTEGYKILADEDELEKPTTPSDSDSLEEPITPPSSKIALLADLDQDTHKIALHYGIEEDGLIPVETESLDWTAPTPLFTQSAVDLTQTAYNSSPRPAQSAEDLPIPIRERNRVYRPCLHSIPSESVALPQLPQLGRGRGKSDQLVFVEAPAPHYEIVPDTTYSTYFPDSSLRRSGATRSRASSKPPSQSNGTPRSSFSFDNLPDVINSSPRTSYSGSSTPNLDLSLQRYQSRRRSRGFSIRLKSLSKSGSCLIQAAKVGDFAETIRRLTEDSGTPDLAATDRDGFTALHHAASQGHSDIARALIMRNADVEACTKKQHRTPLYLAAENGFVDVVEVLLAARANTNRGSKEDGATPLHIAARCGHVTVMKLLIQAGADFNRLDLAQSSPLIYAMRGHQLSAARTLLNYGADTEVRMRLVMKPNFGSQEGLTALHYAVETANHVFARLFLELGANPNSDAEGGERALHRAASKGDEEMVRILLENGAKVMARSNDLWTPLHSAAKNGQKRVCHMLLQAGAHLNATNNKRLTAKQVARANGFPECFVKETRRRHGGK